MSENTSGNLITLGGGSYQVKVCLRVFGDDLEPDDITKLIGCPATRAFKKGEVESSLGERRERIAKTGKWFVELETTVDTEAAVEMLLEKLTSDLSAWKTLTATYKADIFCDIWFDVGTMNGGFGLSPVLMQVLAERGVTIGFNIYWN